ncbi:MAG: D-sedoheptulose 7-phosphate isomerase [Rhizobiaceae bacterium]
MSDFRAYFDEEFAAHRAVADKVAATMGAAVEAMLDAWETSVRAGGKLMFFGNGGSAADAQHIATELVVRYQADRPAIAAMALTTDTSALTAAGNDTGFEQVFARQIEALGRPADLAIGISTSGRSPNVLRALEKARGLGIATAGFTGGSGGRMAELCDHLILVPSPVTARIQEMHITIGHLLCGGLERRLGHA